MTFVTFRADCEPIYRDPIRCYSAWRRPIAGGEGALMKKSKRALVGMVVLDLFLLLGTFWLVMQVKGGASTSVPPAEAISTVTTIGGGAIGLVTAILGMAWFVHRKAGN